MTPGATTETADGTSLAKIDAIIEAVRFERYRWTRSGGRTSRRRTGNGVRSDCRLVGQTAAGGARLILDAYYDPQFSEHSHGFRRGRGCYTALREVYHAWPGTAWFLELDVAQFFDRLDHQILLGILAERIHDGRFLRLIGALLEAGYLENWRFNATLSGVPQGGIVSPVLANVYLDRLDQYIETTLLPRYNYGARRPTRRTSV